MKRLIFYILFALTPLLLVSQTFTVMTYNIRYDNPDDGDNAWSKRKLLLVNQITETNPAILGIQEGLIHQVQYINSSLKNHVYVGVGRTDGKKEGEFNCVFYDTTKLKCIKASTFWLSETPDTPSIGWNAMLERICTYALFKEIKSGKLFWVFNTHFDHFGFVSRQESAKLIHAKIDEINAHNYPIILMGDFNSEPDSKTIKYLTNFYFDSKIAKTSLTYSPEGTFNGFNIKESATKRIDYIFTNKNGIMVRRYGILNKSYNGKYASDHLPVFVEVEIK